MPADADARRFRTLDAIGREISRVMQKGANPTEVEELLYLASDVDEFEPSKLTAFMREYLLPRCVQSPDDSAGGVQSTRLRRVMVDWLNRLPEGVLWRVRPEVIEYIIGNLRTAPTFDALYCLASIGYRSSDTIQAFTDLAERGDRLGDEAIRMLLGLEPAGDALDWIGHRIWDTAFDRRTDELLNAAAQLRDVRFLKFLADDAIRRGPGWFALTRLLWVGQDCPGDRLIQDAVWRAVSRVAQHWQDGVRHLAVTGGVIRYCHSPRALRELLRIAVRLPRGDRGAVQIFRQVAEAESPAQLKGWRGAPIAQVVAAVRGLVETDTNHSGVGQTTESVNKSAGVSTLLSSGSRRAIQVLMTAIERESNPYMTAELMRALSTLPLEILPPRVHAALRTEKGFTREPNENGRLLIYLAAARVATSSRSLESFDELVSSSGFVNGHPLTVPVRGAVAQVLWCARNQGPSVLARLLAGLESASPFAQIVAAKALRVLLEEAPVTEEAMRLLIRLAESTDAKPYVRTAALEAAAVAHRRHSHAGWQGLLLRLFDDEDRDVRYAALSLLIESGALRQARRMMSRLAGSAGDQDRSAFARLTGQLACVDASHYGMEAVSLAADGGSDALQGVLDGFHLAGWQNRAELPEPLADLVIARVMRDESEIRADTGLLADLASLAPSRFLSEKWPRTWERWMPQSRCVFAELVPDAARRAPRLGQQAEYLLLALVHDAEFAVRRSAARSLSRAHEGALAGWCVEAYQSGSIQLRRLAVEAAAWLPVDSETTMDNALVREGVRDPERTVRDAADRAKSDMRRRCWARTLLQQMMSGAADSEGHVGLHYRTSLALARVGDDEDLRTLERLAHDYAYPPNVAYWFERTSEELEKQWKRTTAGWPQPWLNLNGSIERVSAILSASGAEYFADLYLWRRAGKGSDATSAWGGAGEVQSGGGHPWQLAQVHGEVTVTIDGRKSGRALLSSVTNAQVVLTGTGPYPSAARETEDT